MPSRAAIDLMVQRSAFDLFAGMGVSVAPTPGTAGPVREAPDDLIGVVTMTIEGQRATLSLCVPPRTLERARTPPGIRGAGACVQELTNQMAGRVRNRLARYQVRVDMGLPSVFARSALWSGVRDAVSGEGLVYVFRTMTEDVRVELSRNFAALELRYNGTVDVAEEGDVLLF